MVCRGSSIPFTEPYHTKQVLLKYCPVYGCFTCHFSQTSTKEHEEMLIRKKMPTAMLACCVTSNVATVSKKLIKTLQTYRNSPLGQSGRHLFGLQTDLIFQQPLSLPLWRQKLLHNSRAFSPVTAATAHARCQHFPRNSASPRSLRECGARTARVAC